MGQLGLVSLMDATVRLGRRAASVALGRAWEAGRGLGGKPMTIVVDSTICPVVGKTEAGAAYGHTKQLGYRPSSRRAPRPGRSCTPACAAGPRSAGTPISSLGRSTGRGAARWRQRRDLCERRLGVLQLRPVGEPRHPGCVLVGHDPPLRAPRR